MASRIIIDCRAKSTGVVFFGVSVLPLCPKGNIKFRDAAVLEHGDSFVAVNLRMRHIACLILSCLSIGLVLADGLFVCISEVYQKEYYFGYTTIVILVTIRQSPSLCNAILNICPCLLAINTDFQKKYDALAD